MKAERYQVAVRLSELIDMLTAEVVAVVAQEHELVPLIAQKNTRAGRLQFERLAVQVVHGEVEHAIQIHDVRDLGVYGLQLIEGRVHGLLYVAVWPSLDRVQGATGGVPFFLRTQRRRVSAKVQGHAAAAHSRSSQAGTWPACGRCSHCRSRCDWRRGMPGGLYPRRNTASVAVD